MRHGRIHTGLIVALVLLGCTMLAMGAARRLSAETLRVPEEQGRPTIHVADSPVADMGVPVGSLFAGEDESFLRILPNTGGSLFTNAIWGPAVADCDGDGQQEIFFLRVDGFLYGLDALGQDLPNFPIDLVALSGGGSANSTTGHVVALGDLDDDGTLEIVCSIRPGSNVPSRLFVFEPDGSIYPGWPPAGRLIATINHSSCTLRDLDRDGTLEIITGGTNLGGDGTYIYVLRDDGTDFNVNFPHRIYASLSMSSTIAVGDLDGDTWEELVFVANDFQVHALDHRTAAELPGWPVPLNAFRSDVALGDVDDDGNLDVVVIEDNVTPGVVHVLQTDGAELPGWPQEFPGCGCGAGGPSLFDLDGDGRLEVIFGSVDQVNIFHADGTPYPGWPQVTEGAPTINSCVTVARFSDSESPILAYMVHGDFLYAWDAAGQPWPGFPMDFAVPGYASNCWATPVITDLQADGDPEVVVAVFQGSLELENYAEIQAFDLRGEFTPSWRDWAAFHKDNAHTGLVPLLDLSAVQPVPLRSVTLTRYPNPFNPRTSFRFRLPQAGRASLSIFDVRGARVMTLIDGDLPADEQSAEWTGRDKSGAPLPSGIYFARLETPAGVRSVKLTLAR